MNRKPWALSRPVLWGLLALLALLVLLAAGGGEPATSASRQEKRMAEVLSSIAGAGKVEVALFYNGEETGHPTGALVVAQGAGQLSVRLELIRATRTLLGLPEAAVDVFAMGQ